VKLLFARFARIIVKFIITHMDAYLQKRGLRVAHQIWANAVAEQLEEINNLRRMVERSGEIATLRVKYPRVYKRLQRGMERMQDKTIEALAALGVDPTK
jgi:hypothetical protein